MYSLFQYQIAANKKRTFWLIFAFVIFITLLGALFGLYWGREMSILVAGIAFVVAVGMSLHSYYNGDKVVLKMTGARPASLDEFPYLVNTVEGLCLAAGLRHVPRVYVIDDEALNAFATGRDPEHATVCVTTGLLEKLNRQELEGVLAHELAHVYNRDILIMGVAAALVGAVIIMCELVLRGRLWYFGGRGSRRGSGGGATGLIYLAIMILAAILAPILAKMIQFSISRNREYLADATAVNLTRNPDGLASALDSISKSIIPMEHVSTAASHLFIDDPLRAAPKVNWFERMFSTHPPMFERIERIRKM